MYAEREADCLLFQRDNSSAIQLLETDYSKTISHIINRFMRNRNSIPAILSLLTLELFEKQTFVS